MYMTEYEPWMIWEYLFLFIPFLIIIILFLLTQYQTLKLVRSANRCMQPALLIAFVMWITYWILLLYYRKRLKKIVQY